MEIWSRETADETKTEREANKLVKIYDYVMTFVDQSL